MKKTYKHISATLIVMILLLILNPLFIYSKEITNNTGINSLKENDSIERQEEPSLIPSPREEILNLSSSNVVDISTEVARTNKSIEFIFTNQRSSAHSILFEGDLNLNGHSVSSVKYRIWPRNNPSLVINGTGSVGFNYVTGKYTAFFIENNLLANTMYDLEIQIYDETQHEVKSYGWLPTKNEMKFNFDGQWSSADTIYFRGNVDTFGEEISSVQYDIWPAADPNQKVHGIGSTMYDATLNKPVAYFQAENLNPNTSYLFIIYLYDSFGQLATQLGGWLPTKNKMNFNFDGQWASAHTVFFRGNVDTFGEIVSSVQYDIWPTSNPTQVMHGTGSVAHDPTLNKPVASFLAKDLDANTPYSFIIYLYDSFGHLATQLGGWLPTAKEPHWIIQNQSSTMNSIHAEVNLNFPSGLPPEEEQFYGEYEIYEDSEYQTLVQTGNTQTKGATNKRYFDVSGLKPNHLYRWKIKGGYSRDNPNGLAEITGEIKTKQSYKVREKLVDENGLLLKEETKTVEDGYIHHASRSEDLYVNSRLYQYQGWLLGNEWSGQGTPPSPAPPENTLIIYVHSDVTIYHVYREDVAPLSIIDVPELEFDTVYRKSTPQLVSPTENAILSFKDKRYVSNGWKLSAKMSDWVNIDDNSDRIYNTKLYLPRELYLNDNQAPSTVIGAQGVIELLPNNTTTLFSSPTNEDHKGIWKNSMSKESIKLLIPADRGEVGQNYKSTVHWSLEDTI